MGLVAVCGILIPQPGIDPGSPALGAWSLNHWTAREVSGHSIFYLATPTQGKFDSSGLVETEALSTSPAVEEDGQDMRNIKNNQTRNKKGQQVTSEESITELGFFRIWARLQGLGSDWHTGLSK